MGNRQEYDNLWLETPLILSGHLSSLLRCDVYLKLETLQPSQSFKFRGISYFAQYCKQKHGPNTHLVIASGGNAGLAAACAAKHLGLKCTVYIPKQLNQKMLDLLKKEDAEVIVAGTFYFEALKEAEKAVQSDEHSVMIPAYDDPLVWEGHSSLVKEISSQLPKKPDLICCSVGGGGLLGGIIVGCKHVGWDDVPILALETHGSACFYHSIGVNEGRWNTAMSLPDGITAAFDHQHNVRSATVQKITSNATSLNASSPSPSVVKMALDRAGGITCATVSDEMSMQAAQLFAEDHKMLAELACSTTLTVAYNPHFFSFIRQMVWPSNLEPIEGKTIVLVVCGGVKISLDELKDYGEIVDRISQEAGREWVVHCNGEKRSIPI